MAGADPRELDGDATFEGDVMSETAREGGVEPDHRGRTNRERHSPGASRDGGRGASAAGSTCSVARSPHAPSIDLC